MEAGRIFTKLELELKPDPSRTVVRPFDFAWVEGFEDGRPPRREVVASRLLSLEPDYRERMLQLLLNAMRPRHRDVERVLCDRYHEVEDRLGVRTEEARDQLLLGAYFSQEYAFESAALFNPSIIPLPDQSEDGETVRFLLALRGIGEGHISSVTFRTGSWDGGDRVTIDPASPQCSPPRIDHKDGGWVRLHCPTSQELSETVIFPTLPSQTQGVEDLRLVRFTDHDGTVSSIGTYTATDGRTARSEMLRGIDPRTFEMRPLEGAMAAHKGMALFPRRVNGRFAMLGRQDGERVWLLFSDDLHRWDEGVPILEPAYPWEFVQLGNCGSPIEVDEGWLVFTHGVGMVRGYCVGACLLDRDDPSRVLARTPSPLLFPSKEQRGGYVPNVTYSCGALVQGRQILLPYAVGDEYTAFAVGSVDDVIKSMEPSG